MFCVRKSNISSGLPVAVLTPDDSLEEVFVAPQDSVTVANLDKDQV